MNHISQALGGIPLRVLVVDDSTQDAELAVLELRRYGFAVTAEFAQTRAEIEENLGFFDWNIVLSDHAMPQLSSHDVLELLEERETPIPCIVVSGAVGEEAAVHLMQLGASDLINKSQLHRLGPAVDRALRETATQRARLKAEAALKRANDELEARVEARTAELQGANEQLEHENANRRRAEGELNALRIKLADIRERERRHLARELHDGAVQQLIGISYGLAESQKGLGSAHPEYETLGAHRKAVLGVSKELRHLIGGLRPSGLEELGLEVTLRNYLTQLRGEKHGVDIDADIQTDGRTVSAPVALCLFRTAQEALRNVFKHARARRAEVSLQLREGAAVLKVRDDGQGFTPPEQLSALAHDNHFGLIGLEEHIASVGGTLEIRAAPQAGTQITASVPVAKPVEAETEKRA